MPNKILVIRDSRTEALKTRLVLEKEGFQVRVATDGVEGLQQAAADPPDLILLDTIMRGVNGFETCGKLKLDPKTNRIPVVMLGSSEEMNEMPSGSALECFLPVPVEMQALISKVKTWPNGRSHEDTSLQTSVQALTRELAEAKRARSDLLANMSHELRTPLHEITGMTELLGGTTLSPEQQGFLNTIRNSSNALLSLIGDVLEFSEIQTGQLQLETKPFDLNDPLQRCLEVMKPRANEKGLAFNVTLAMGTPNLLKGDSKRVRQILMNLSDNAIKFTERGEIAIEVNAEKMNDDTAELHMRVRDTGIGITPEKMETIFEPFQQEDNSSTRRFGGSGMGLALAKQLVTLMQGKIWVESVPGQGSTFHFTLPFQRQLVQAAAPQAAARAMPTSLAILVAEDSPTNQLIARSSLSKAGHKVTLAVNGLEAVKAFEASRAPDGKPFDLVLMDISMPEMDGLDATRAIREREKTIGGHLLVIAMTAFATQDYREKCAQAVMDAYVTKPVRIDELNRTLEELMSQAAPPPEEPAPAAEAASDEIPVNLSEALEVVGGDVDILRDAVAMTLEEVPEQIDGLNKALAASDAKQIEAKAHRLKGIMGNLGGLQARDVGQQLETYAEHGETQNAPALAQAFLNEIKRVLAFYNSPDWEARAAEVANG